MIYEELYLNLNYNQKLILAIAIVAIFILVQIVVRMKNKAKKCKKKQIIYKKHKKIFNPANFISNYNEFIAENTKNMYLYEIKEFKKTINKEIYSMILKGVR